MTTRAYRQLATAIYDAFNTGDDDVLGQYYTKDFVDHQVTVGHAPGVRGVRTYIAMFREAFPDIRFDMVDLMSEKDRMVAHLRITGTHQGTYLGIQATGRQIDVGAVDVFRIREGKVCEHWGYLADLAILDQLGVVPTPQPAIIRLPREARAG